MTTSFFTIDNNGYLIVNVDNLDRDPPSPAIFRFQVLITQHSSYHVITLTYDERLGKDTRYADTVTFYCHTEHRTPACSRTSCDSCNAKDHNKIRSVERMNSCRCKTHLTFKDQSSVCKLNKYWFHDIGMCVYPLCPF
jgi:hypothetical protein